MIAEGKTKVGNELLAVLAHNLRHGEFVIKSGKDWYPGSCQSFEFHVSAQGHSTVEFSGVLAPGVAKGFNMLSKAADNSLENFEYVVRLYDNWLTGSVTELNYTAGANQIDHVTVKGVAT